MHAEGSFVYWWSIRADMVNMFKIFMKVLIHSLDYVLGYPKAWI